MKEQSWVRRSTGSKECIEAFFHGVAYAPHRHDTYTLALTISGVQSFNYRGEMRHSQFGNAVVLHPDELHDGQAGTAAGFGYRSICIAPADIQNALCGRPLPFVATGVSSSRRLIAILDTLLSELDAPLDQTEYDDTIFDLAMTLVDLSDDPRDDHSTDYAAVQRAREYIDDRVCDGFTMNALEQATGRDRWQVSRDFRSIMGTSPYRYLIMRRLDRARALLLQGRDIADASNACSFADQSHFNRHFKKTYGMTPKNWLRYFRKSS